MLPYTHGPTTHRSLGVYTISDLLFLLCSFLPRAITECVIMSPWHPSTQYFQNKITKYEQQWPGLSWWEGGSSKWWICFRPRLPTICYNLVQLCGVSTKCVPRPSAHVEHTLQYSSIDTIKNFKPNRNTKYNPCTMFCYWLYFISQSNENVDKGTWCNAHCWDTDSFARSDNYTLEQ